ncbi:MAG: hypothetical protein IE933_12555 [Sphingomonadales bacterium]|nr:hypothetical protein [Sphingomonadales bacterium]MBD3774657.1 hypothetical protein [Paracoccaceae bacterium]
MSANRILLAIAMAAAPAMLSLAPAPLAAQAAPATGDAYDELLDLFTDPARADDTFKRMLFEALPQALLANPDVAALEQRCPGATTAMMKAGEPNLHKSFLRDQQTYRSGLSTILHEELTPQQAAEMAEFFRDPKRRQVFELAFESNDFANLAASVAADPEGEISQEAIDADEAKAARTLRDRIGPADYADIDYAFRTAPWYPALMRAMPRVNALRSQIDKAAPDPQEDAELEQLMTGALEVHLQLCLGEEVKL